jgi:teichuronic acid exporter
MSTKASSSISSSIAFKFIERFGTQMVNLVLNVILARLLMPEDYGTLAILNVFIVLAQVISQNGINNALIQKADVDDDDYSTGLVLSLLISAGLYLLIFITAPFISVFYDMPSITIYLRVIALSLFPGAINTIYNAKVMREMKFKIVMITGMVSNTTSCALGVAAAYFGLEVWALIISQMSAVFILLFMFIIMLRWPIGLRFYKDRAKALFGYGYKIIIASIIDNLYYDFENLFVGKVMSREILGFYTNARTYPLRVVSSIKDTIAGVIFPAMANEQENNERMRDLAKKSIQLFSFVVFPLMIGFALVAKEFILVLLTDKWLTSLTPMIMFSIGLAFLSLSAPNIQIIKAKGYSGLYLKVECIRKGIILATLIATAAIWGTIDALSIGSMASTILTALFIMQVCGHTIGYSLFHQIRDVLKNIICVVVMAGVVIGLSVVIGNKLPLIVMLVVKVFAGATSYILCAAIIKNPMLKEVIRRAEPMLKKFSKR